MPDSDGRAGIAAGLAAAALFGVSIPISKWLLVDLPPQTLASLLYFGSGMGLTLWLRLGRTPISEREAPFRKDDAPFLAGSIFFGGVLAPLILLVGLLRTPSSTASLLVNFEGVFTTLLAWSIFRESIDRRIAAGMLAIFAAGLLLAWNGSFDKTNITGPALIAGACVCWGLDNNLSQRLSLKDPRRIAAIKGLVAGSINGLAAMFLGQPIHVASIPAALAVGFFCYGLSLVFYIRALRALGTARTGNYFSAAPFIGAALSVLLLGEVFTARLAGAGVLMIVGVWLHISESHAHRHIHPAETHEHRHIHDEHHQHEHAAGDPPGEPHSHPHRHERLEHEHAHYPDIHHRHTHSPLHKSDGE